MPAALEARDVVKRHRDGFAALRGVGLTVETGETLALIGESGSGKTTLLRMFNRLDTPTTGEIRIQGRPAAAHDPIALRRATGYVQQDGGLLPHWTVGRNVELVPALLGWPPGRRRARADQLLGWVGLDPAAHRDRYPVELSGGQRQRVAIARALAGDPPVVLLDEPFAALDALTRQEIQGEFARWRRDLGKTLVLVTHDVGEAFRLADRIAVLRAGVVLQVGTAADLVQRPAHPYVRALVGPVHGAAS
jgi:osmoprotectant transport system ATP-binding protein